MQRRTLPTCFQRLSNEATPTIAYISKRYRLYNPIMSVKMSDAEKIDWRYEKKGDMKSNDYKHPSYTHLDWTNSDFLSDLNEEHLPNTYPEYHKSWMKNFMKFTDAEFESFSNKNKESTGTTANNIGYSARISNIEDEVSQPMKYLHEWRQRMSNKTMADDYEVRLPNGLVIPYDQYLKNLKQQQKDSSSPAEKQPEFDEYGRAHGSGTRKSAYAQAMVYAGNGTIYVNGKHYSQFFLNYSDRLDICLPLLVTDTHREFDVWCDVDSGGLSGKAGAIRLAIARAIINYEPKFEGILKAYNLSTCDWRNHERKKPGKKRARKSGQWKVR